MRRIKLNIKTSDRGDYEYYIYRSVDETEIPNDINTLAGLDPVFVLQEDVMEHTALINSDVLKVNKNKIPRDGRIPYELDYKPVISSIHEIIVTAVTPNGSKIFTIEFDTTQAIETILLEEEDGSKTFVETQNIEVINNNIYINNALIDTATEISAQYYIEVVEIYDDDEKIVQGLTKNASEAHGLPKPIANFTEMLNSPRENTDIGYINVNPSAGDLGLNYYYRMVAKDPLGNISDPSNLLATMLSQRADEIKYKLEYNESGSTNEDNGWDVFAENLNHDELFTIGKPGTENYDKYGKVYEDLKQSMTPQEITYDNSLVNSDSKLIVKVPNIWLDDEFQNKYAKANPFAFRLKVVDNLGEESEPTDVFELENKKLPLEQIVVYRKNVSGETIKNKAITHEEVANGSATVMHTFVKKGGLGYDVVTDADIPLNQEIPEGNKSAFDSTCDYARVGFVDDACFPGQVYNYTVYIYDGYEEASDGTVIVVDNTATAN